MNELWIASGSLGFAIKRSSRVHFMNKQKSAVSCRFSDSFQGCLLLLCNFGYYYLIGSVQKV